jgi:folate-binding protein YgfZ
MTTQTPLKPLHIQSGALLRTYGPEEAGIELVEAFDFVEGEYAAIRKHAAIFDAPHRATLEITGPDRFTFLHSMISQDMRHMSAGDVRRAFWLSRKGRIDADLRLLELGDKMLADLDAHNAAPTLASLGAYIIAEDVSITDATPQWHRLSVHGPAARALLSRHVDQPDAVMRLEPDHALRVNLLGREAILDRQDVTGEVGLEILIPVGHAETVYTALAAPHDSATRLEGRGYQADREGRARRIGWHALNIARIEAGTPLYNIDFGPSNLPHETGEILHDRVSFTKGCYLGQEIVARMDALGNPKQKLVGLRMWDLEGAVEGGARVPPAGAPVYFESAPDKRDVVGAVTSSTISPMLGGVPIAFAMVKFKHAMPGTKLLVEAEGGALLKAEVRERLRFLK